MMYETIGYIPFIEYGIAAVAEEFAHIIEERITAIDIMTIVALAFEHTAHGKHIIVIGAANDRLTGCGRNGQR